LAGKNDGTQTLFRYDVVGSQWRPNYQERNAGVRSDSLDALFRVGGDVEEVSP